MGFVTNDPKKSDEQQPGGFGLTFDLDLQACPQCRRELPDWVEECPDCGVAPVSRSSLESALPDIPAHLLDDDASDGPPTGN